MDVYGQNPTTEDSAYFRHNVWYWHSLTAYIQAVAAKIAAKGEHWHSTLMTVMAWKRRDQLACTASLRKK